MPECRVQQFYEDEDDFFNLGGPRLIVLAAEELTLLEGGTGEPVLLDRLMGFFMLAEDRLEDHQEHGQIDMSR